MGSELYNEIDYDEDYIGSFYSYKSETNHRRYKNCKVNMFMKEVCGDIPHIYLVNHDGDTCRVKLLTNEYFRDEKDGEHPYSLTKLEREAFNDRIHFVCPCNDGLSAWDIFLSEWINKWYMGREGATDDYAKALSALNPSAPDYREINEPQNKEENI